MLVHQADAPGSISKARRVGRSTFCDFHGGSLPDWLLLARKTMSEIHQITDDGCSWFAVQTRTTHEKRVACLLDYQQYECFLPLYTARRRWSDRIKQVELPLFPGYVFCRFDVHARGPVLKTPSVISIAGVAGKPIPIDDHEIAAIQRIHTSQLGVLPHPFLRVGQRVRLEGGSLDGLEGIIE